MYEVVIPEKAPEFVLVINKKEQKCLMVLKKEEMQIAINIVDALNAVEIFGVSVNELINQKNSFENALRSICSVYDLEEDFAGARAKEALKKHNISFF